MATTESVAGPTTRTRPVARRLRAGAFATVAGIATFLTAGLTVGSTGELVTGDHGPDERLTFITHLPWLGLCWCAAFAAMLWRPARRPAAYQQGLATGAALYLGGLVLAREADPVFYVGFGVVLLALGLLHPVRRSLLRPGTVGISPLLVPLALAGAAPLAFYATRMLRLHADTGPEDPFYLGIAVTALTVPLVGLAAGLRAPGWRLPLWVTGATLAVLCGGSLLERGATAAMPVWAAVLGVVGAVAFVAVGEWERRRLGTVAAQAISRSPSDTARRSVA